MYQQQKAFLVRTAYGAVWVILLYLAARYLLLWLLPFLIALGLAALAEPAIDFCRRKMRFKRSFTAAVLTLAMNMLLQLLEMSASTMTVPWLPFLPQLMQCITLNQRYAQIASGVIYPTDIGYFLAFTAVFLAATVVVLARRKQKRR